MHKGHGSTWWAPFVQDLYDCAGSLQRVPAPVPNETLEEADGAKWLCGMTNLARKNERCDVLSVGSNFNDKFESSMHEVAGCRSYVIDPTLLRGPSETASAQVAAFAERLSQRGDILNSSVGVGPSGGALRLPGRNATLVALSTLLHEARQQHGFFAGGHLSSDQGGQLHVHVFKADTDTYEFDILPELFDLCASGRLRVGQLLIEVHAGGWFLGAAARGRSASEAYGLFRGALACGLLLHHHESNLLSNERDVEVSWVNIAHAAMQGKAYSE